MGDQGNVVACPICSKELPIQKINNHIDICLRTSGQEVNKRQRPDDGGEDDGDFEDRRKRKKVSLNESDTSTSTTSTTDIVTSAPNIEGTPNNNFRRIRPSTGQFVRQKPNVHDDAGNCVSTKSSSLASKSNKRSQEPEQGKTSWTIGTKVLPSRSDDKRSLDPQEFRPLAERMRPKCMEDFIGQDDLFGNNRILKKLITTGQVSSLILCGPPGSGKTTLACIIAKKIKEHCNSKLVKLSATTSNVAEVKKVIAEAGNMQRMFKRKTILFMDEIHRFNKLQQDTFLPFIEDGTITLLGATTENPSFSLNSALLSRCQVIALKKHPTEDLITILENAAVSMGVVVMQDGESNANGETGDSVKIEKEALRMLANLCDGDARSALNVLEMATRSCQGQESLAGGGQNLQKMQQVDKTRVTEEGGTGGVITIELIKDSLQRSHIDYDRTGEEHYNCISALHKSMRGGDADAGLYWLGRMLIGGEDPLYVARRLIEFSSVDVGLADPGALVQAVSTFQACQFLGMPVCEFNLAQCVTYLARAPKSPEIYAAYEKVKTCITEHQGPMPGVPLHLRNVSPQVLQRMGLLTERDQMKPKSFLPEGLENVRFFRFNRPSAASWMTKR